MSNEHSNVECRIMQQRAGRSRTRKGAIRPALFFTCPNTNQRAPTGVLTDVQSLRASWSKTLKVKCSFCGQVHSFEVHELYAENAMWNAADTFRRA